MASLSKKKKIYYIREKEKIAGQWKEKWIKLGAIPAAQAKAVLLKYETDKTYLRLGIQADSHMTFSEAVTDYIDFQKTTPTKSKKTLEIEFRRLERLSNDLPSFKIAKMDPEAINAFFVNKNYSPNTIRLDVAAIRSVYRFALRRKYLKEDPSQDLFIPKLIKNPPKHLSYEDIQKVLGAIPKQSRAPYEIMYYTGMRPIECLRLKRKNIDFKNKMIDLYPEQTKTAERGLLPLHPKLEILLKELTKNKKEDDYLFPHPRKENEHQESLKNALRRASQKTGIPITPYQFRHSFATHLLDKTKDLRTVQQLMRHKNISMTTRYATALDKRLKDAIESL